MRRALFVLGVLLLGACTEPEDDPTTVKDLRVLGIRMDPPEVLANTCDPEDASALITFAQPVRLTALVEDPAGAGRSLDYTLWACTSTNDPTCEEGHVELARGSTAPGELVVDLSPGPAVARLPDGTFVVQKVVEEDPYRGLGGIRLPLVLWVRGGDEQVYTQKLMVYGCRYFPEMQPNVQPELPGLLLDGTPWDEGVVRELQGPGPFRLEPVDFSALQEPYVVPSFELQPVHLSEQWKLSWYTSLGRMSRNETGGVSVAGEPSRHVVKWEPPSDAPAGDVRFWVVSRDGRGGLSWVTRTIHYAP